ncbi:MAG TPA: four helix bundle protein [Candidatus Angelobacter sp.]|nr:four helix bundle protein [Candidatus Angelobacter sp.]
MGRLSLEKAMRNYRDLQVWTKAHYLTLELYRISQLFPREEMYGITNQLRRAAVSIGANLAEGCGRRSSSELARFVRIAMGSASELDYHLLLSRDLGFMAANEFTLASSALTEIRKMLTSFLNSVEEQIEIQSKAAGTS